MAKRPSARSEVRDMATASKPPRTSREAASSTASSGPNEDDIRRRAYQRYLERGGSDGQDFDDWLQAERELKQQL
jgi:Protein of unknown function (DUF2934)